MNFVGLLGRLCADPIVHNAEDPERIVSVFSIAVDRWNGDADFFDCVCFGKTAEFSSKYLHKGSKVAISGQLRSSRYMKDDGTTIFRTEVLANHIDFAESKKDAEAYSDTAFTELTEDLEKELPFA